MSNVQCSHSSVKFSSKFAHSNTHTHKNIHKSKWWKKNAHTQKKLQHRNNEILWKTSNSSTSTKTEEAQPEITMPPSPPRTSSSSSSSTAAAATTGSHAQRRGLRTDKHSNRYTKSNQSTANLATPRRPLRTPTSSPLTMSSGLNNFMSPRTRLVSENLRQKNVYNVEEWLD